MNVEKPNPNRLFVCVNDRYKLPSELTDLLQISQFNVTLFFRTITKFHAHIFNLLSGNQMH